VVHKYFNDFCGRGLGNACGHGQASLARGDAVILNGNDSDDSKISV
jgi:hypothetical protein